ncbi:TPA: hypothetical protein H1016_03335 [archaeon]|uniref:Uncharacterized protein n=1 Tax=Candidatus Naiadarchaeum limnaeum TaxID=2756139 RepID=A0A832XJG0_9ARCH|nr:hypothetical protein [Candidatus Naiadarchaeum limnaeum]
MADAASYNRKGAHNIDMGKADILRAFEQSERIAIKEPLRTCKNPDYIQELFKYIQERSRQTNSEIVIGAWGRPYGGESEIAGYSLHTKEEAKGLLLISQRDHFSTDPFFGCFYDGEWFERKLQRLCNDAPQKSVK